MEAVSDLLFFKTVSQINVDFRSSGDTQQWTGSTEAGIDDECLGFR